MKAKINLRGEVELTPENEAEHAVLQYTEYETVEMDLEEQLGDKSDLSTIVVNLNVSVEDVVNNIMNRSSEGNILTDDSPRTEDPKSIYPDDISDGIENIYKYIAMDECGEVFVFTIEPYIDDDDDFWSSYDNDFKQIYPKLENPVFWKDSLESRPE